MDVSFFAVVPEVGNSQEMYVWGIIPLVRQCFGYWDSSFEEYLESS